MHLSCAATLVINLFQQTRKSEFCIWYVNAQDPWDRVMYDMVVKQMRENNSAKGALRKRHDHFQNRSPS